MRRWWAVWALSWPVAAVAFVLWRTPFDGRNVALTGGVLLLALPGILGPNAVIPVGVDLPTTALMLVGCWLFQHSPGAGLIVFCVAAAGKETAPVWAALWLWTCWPLLALVVPVALSIIRDTGPDPLGPRFDAIAKHPIRAALNAHRGRWRDPNLMLLPWGVCLLALYHPSWQVVVLLSVAYAQLLVATDTVRLYQHAAAPVLAFSAARHIPTAWLPAACVLAVVWPMRERI